MSETISLPTIRNGPKNADTLVILAHGAGAPMDSEFMEFFSEKLALSGMGVLRFEFPYMALRRQGLGKRPPNSQKILMASWRQIINDSRNIGKSSLFIGGKSMGGRIASMIADEMRVNGLICLGYPFYAPGKIEKPRIEHLLEMKTPALFLQGERDPMGTREVVSRYSLPANIELDWYEDGNHDLVPRKKTCISVEDHHDRAVEAILRFISNTE